MKKKIVLIITLIILSIFIISESKTLIKTLTNTNKEFENVKTINIFDNKDKTLSIMLQEDGTTFKEAEDRSKWPDVASYIFDKAECTDSEGNSIDYKSVLTFNLDTKTTTIKTKNTVYCTLYFVKGKETLTLLQAKGSGTFIEKSGMYRFVGTSSQVKNNYICFGTTILNDCTSKPSTYMYRIIGMTKDSDTNIDLHAGQLKIIKATPSKSDQKWNSNKLTGQKWETSSVKNYLNGEFLNTIKNGTNGIYWNKLITNQNWYIKDQDRKNSPGATSEPVEEKTTNPSQIALMYATDYMNANSASTSNWLFIQNGWSTNSAVPEWTMTRYGNEWDYFSAWLVLKDGTMSGSSGVDGSYSVRPVFYLKPGILLTGDGSTTDPFRIAG